MASVHHSEYLARGQYGLSAGLKYGLSERASTNQFPQVLCGRRSLPWLRPLCMRASVGCANLSEDVQAGDMNRKAVDGFYDTDPLLGSVGWEPFSVESRFI